MNNEDNNQTRLEKKMKTKQYRRHQQNNLTTT